MTRLQAKDFLISLGIEEPTDEAVSNYLNSVNGEIKKEKDRAEQYKKDADKVAELQKALDELNSANLSDIEKANKMTETAQNEVAELKRQIAQMNTKNSLLANGLTDDEANKVIESLNGGSFDASIIGSIIADRQKSAIAEYEKKNLQSTPNPDGGNGGEEPKAKTDMDIAVELAKTSLGGADKSADIVNAYK